MPSLYTKIEIELPKSQVWRILFQKDRWKYWNTFLYDCDSGRPFTQGRETILSLRRALGEEPIEFQPTVTLVQPGYCLQWFSTIPGFRNEHVFELQEVGRNRTQYIHQERFSGALSKLFLPFIRRDEQRGIQRMAWELKGYAERSRQNFR